MVTTHKKSTLFLAASLVLIGGLDAGTNTKQRKIPTMLLQGPGIALAADGAMTGKVVETLNSAGYTYILLDVDGTKSWVAIPEAEVKVGQEVTTAPGMVMNNYTSKTLNRTFDAVIFSSGLVGGAGAAPASAGASMPKDDPHVGLAMGGGMGSGMGSGMGESGGSKAAAVGSVDVKVDKATGDNSYTVGELFGKGAELDGKTVRVRGKVTKVSAQIMGRNWVHLQDGSGESAKSTHDLVLTSGEMPEKDTVVTMEGVLHANRDFGYGYHYDVIIEEAKVLP